MFSILNRMQKQIIFVKVFFINCYWFTYCMLEDWIK